ncbi:metallophosphoesterase [Microbacterium sp.]|uniref:metallophosphoesterase family protein n=1 Tax=Microbacterium sp. TaxID=51671 RepID=UPI00273366E8|nr:metallophosphoesterase [Microbacterium sp.]MDP3952986.1 metallophosphoesterase [Microbacterium sp.]
MQTLESTGSFDLPDERVWLVGDVHGNAGWIQALLPAMRRFDPSIRTILQVGDYGFDHGGHGTHAVDFWAKKAGIDRVLVTLGNHEDWGRIAPAQAAAAGMALRVSDVVWLLPRPFRFQVAGREVLSLGGASSVDKSYRIPGKDWFEEELITETMEASAVAGGRADVLLTHESPARAVPEVQALLTENPLRWPDDALVLSAEQRERVQRVSDAVLPTLHIHGHMHVYGDIEHADGRRVISLDRDTFAGNAGVLDIPTMTFEPLSMSAIRGRV